MFELKYKQFEFKWLSVNLYNKFCIGTFTLGSTLIADSFTLNWWNLFVFNVNASSIELAYNQVDDFNTVELVFGLTFIVLSIVFFLLKKKYELWYKTKYPRNLIAIKQQGLQATSFPDFNKKTAGKDFRSFCVHPILVDEIDFDKNKKYKEALDNQDRIITNITNLKNSHINNELAYWGITRIPLAFSLGVKLSDTQSINVFDYNRNKQVWNQLSYSWLRNKIIRSKKFTIKKSNIYRASSQDLIISVSTTFNVSKSECLKIVPDYYKFYDLSLSNIGNGKRDRFKTISEINILTEQFRQLMDEVATDPRIKIVHLFYAGPNSLAFKFGTVYSESIHRNVIVYNYNGNDTPCFSWAYNVAKNKILC
ncbi:SAVED domain-containing protein [Ancylomarina sp. 16SWW S1-10-2]|uniref:SAVED domain-containing protein n=1 Tax=Ancylomarina sp. 16SWW S1-10-2 TaxID=2499681 RepID=UPI0012AD589B|nr:SAVED domain-containing protein [Ancylomarina sp. 16SWW S1-10-2]MRT94580.1 SAVED domain-containing protein [Ancylomarina sp. 16SWW S1-10-2]